MCISEGRSWAGEAGEVKGVAGGESSRLSICTCLLGEIAWGVRKLAAVELACSMQPNKKRLLNDILFPNREQSTSHELGEWITQVHTVHNSPPRGGEP